MVIAVRPKTAADTERLMPLWTGHFGAPVVVARGQVHDPRLLDGLVAEEGGALLDAMADYARARGVRRLFLVTTNDNTRAIRFYQKRGWDMCALHRRAVAAARKIKPQIPLLGEDGIAIRHEIEFERLVAVR